MEIIDVTDRNNFYKHRITRSLLEQQSQLF